MSGQMPEYRSGPGSGNGGQQGEGPQAALPVHGGRHQRVLAQGVLVAVQVPMHGHLCGQLILLRRCQGVCQYDAILLREG